MAVAPKDSRAARLALPWLPLPAILGFALLGVGGSVFIAYSTFSYGEAQRAANPPETARVYEARAVPFDSPRLEHAQPLGAIARALTATKMQVRHAEDVEPERRSEPVLLADSDRPLPGFNRFGNFAGANTYLAVAGTTFGISAQTLPSGFTAPDAETAMAAPVPESSTWMCGAALFVLVAARGMRAHLHRKQRRRG
ncbi:MAG: hypothetical protein QOI07_2706 [Verrucomicrobiota bacterium]|jgi:hypothetical protein